MLGKTRVKGLFRSSRAKINTEQNEGPSAAFVWDLKLTVVHPHREVSALITILGKCFIWTSEMHGVPQGNPKEHAVPLWFRQPRCHGETGPIQ